MVRRLQLMEPERRGLKDRVAEAVGRLRDGLLRDNKVLPPVLAALALIIFAWLLAGAIIGDPEEEERVARQAAQPSVAQAPEDGGGSSDTPAPGVENRDSESLDVYESKDPFRELFPPADADGEDAADDGTGDMGTGDATGGTGDDGMGSGWGSDGSGGTGSGSGDGPGGGGSGAGGNQYGNDGGDDSLDQTSPGDSGPGGGSGNGGNGGSGGGNGGNGGSGNGGGAGSGPSGGGSGQYGGDGDGNGNLFDSGGSLGR